MSSEQVVKVVKKLVMVSGPHRGGGITASQIRHEAGSRGIVVNDLVDGSAVAEFYQGTARTLFPRSFNASELPQLFVLEQVQIDGKEDGEVMMTCAISGASVDRALTLLKVHFNKWAPTAPPAEDPMEGTTEFAN